MQMQSQGALPGYKGFPHNDLAPPVMIRLNLVIDICFNPFIYEWVSLVIDIYVFLNLYSNVWTYVKMYEYEDIWICQHMNMQIYGCENISM